MSKSKYSKLAKFTAILLIIFLSGMFTAGVAVAAELVSLPDPAQLVAKLEASGNVNAIEVIQGQTVNFTIQLSATGIISQDITSDNPSIVIIRTSYSISDGGAMTTADFSSWFPFFAGSGQGVVRDVTWLGATNPYNVSARVTAGPVTPVGIYIFTITSFVYNPILGLTHGGQTQMLFNTTADTFIVRVVSAPASVDTTPPTITAPAAVTVEGNTTGGATGVPLGTPVVSDIVDANPVVTNNAPSFFPLGPTTVIWTARDASGNSATATQIVTVVDTRAPVITAPATFNVTIGYPSTLLTGTATDIVDPNPMLTNNAPVIFGSGNTTVIWTARDDTGNVATATTTVTATVTAMYHFGGIRQPIKVDGSSVFRLGRTVPVKFQLLDNNGLFVTNAIARIFVIRVNGGVIGKEIEAISTSAATTGNYFRYCHKENQYIFNWSTRGLGRGVWEIRIVLNDGTRRTVRVSLR